MAQLDEIKRAHEQRVGAVELMRGINHDPSQSDQEPFLVIIRQLAKSLS
jgi:hypothetical protein